MWLDPERTSPYRFYQFWLNTGDADVVGHLKRFTLLDEAEVRELSTAVEDAPYRREAQRRLAAEVTRTVHGPEGLDRAVRASQVLFGGSLEGLDADDVSEIFADVPSAALARSCLEGDGMELTAVMAKVGMASSKGEARRLLRGGGVYVNGVRATDPAAVLGVGDAVEGRFVVVRVGKKRYFVVEVG